MFFIFRYRGVGTRKTSTTAVEAALPDTKRLISLTDGLFNGLFNHGNRGTTTQQFGIRCAFYNMRSLNSCRTAVRFWGQITQVESELIWPQNGNAVVARPQKNESGLMELEFILAPERECGGKTAEKRTYSSGIIVNLTPKRECGGRPQENKNCSSGIRVNLAPKRERGGRPQKNEITQVELELIWPQNGSAVVKGLSCRRNFVQNPWPQSALTSQVWVCRWVGA